MIYHPPDLSSSSTSLSLSQLLNDFRLQTGCLSLLTLLPPFTSLMLLLLLLLLNRLPFVLGLTIWVLSLSSAVDPSFNEFACVISSCELNRTRTVNSIIHNHPLPSTPTHLCLRRDSSPSSAGPPQGRCADVRFTSRLWIQIAAAGHGQIAATHRRCWRRQSTNPRS